MKSKNWKQKQDEAQRVRNAMNQETKVIAENLRKLCDSIRIGSKRSEATAIHPRVRALLESAHYAVRRVASGGWSR